MLKRILFAVAPLILVAGSVMADDSLLSSIATMDLDNAKTAAPADQADTLGQADVDALLGDGEPQSTEKAVAACFGGIGYGYGGYGYGGYGFRSYGYGYGFGHSFYRPAYYSYYTPIFSSYWGCW